MLWEVEIRPKGSDPERDRVCDEYHLLTRATDARDLVRGTARGYHIEGDLDGEQIQHLVRELLVDPLVEVGRVANLERRDPHSTNGTRSLTVVLKSGVMDPVAMSVTDAARNLGLELGSVRTFRRYFLIAHRTPLTTHHARRTKVVANDAIEPIIEGPRSADPLTLGQPYDFQVVRVPIRALDEQALLEASRSGQLSLSLWEMKAIQAHYRELRREPI